MGISAPLAKGKQLMIGRIGRSCVAGLALLALAACGETLSKGYLLDQSALAQVPVGSSQEQVQVVLGTPSTIATLNGEVFYYISTKTEQKVNFLRPQVIDQRVLAVYFDKDRRVEKIADYGVKDGKLFDFVTRTTPTVGGERSFLAGVFKGVLGGDPD
jgi:outer membrane protein assembly factor BamE (lipoprotein component of BamABCDE complex)